MAKRLNYKSAGAKRIRKPLKAAKPVEPKATIDLIPKVSWARAAR